MSILRLFLFKLSLFNSFLRKGCSLFTAITVFTFFGGITLNSTHTYAQYCSPTYLPTGAWAGQPACGSNFTFPAGHAITSVVIGTINNAVPVANCTTSNFTSLSTTVLAAGVCLPTPLTVTTTGFCGVSVAVDLNNNNNFSDPGEIVIASAYVGANPATYNLSLAIPVGTSAGPHRMRIYNSGANSGAETGACGTYQFGNFQDYTIDVVVDPNAGRIVETQFITICADELPYSWNGKTIAAGGSIVDSFEIVNAQGCDSITYLNLTVNPLITETVHHTICISELPYIWNGNTINMGGAAVATFVTPSAAGCDSTTILNLTVNPEENVTQNTSICANELPYTWNGNTITAGGTAVATYITPSQVTGCDSTTTLNLTVNAPVEVTIDTTICTRDFYFFNQENHNTTKTLNHTFKTVEGCDSAVTVHLYVKPCCDRTIFVPMSFTPNMDGTNDRWDVVVGKESVIQQIRVWNRWGQLVYDRKNNTSWDGTINGTPAEQGTYFYEVNATCKDGNAIYKKGDLLLIR